MKVIFSNYFRKQVDSLSKKYPKISSDIDVFSETFDGSVDADLWSNIYKIRRKNSSIPVWKRWWFRIIVFIVKEESLCVPLLIYPKSHIETVSSVDIENALEKTLNEDLFV